MKKIKVLFIAPRVAPHVGGVETHLAEIVPILEKHAVEVRILAAEKPLGKLQAWGKTLWYWRWLAWADVIHVHDVFYWILPWYVILRLAGKRIFMTFHGYEAPGPITKKQIFWHRLAARLTAGSIGVGGFHPEVYGVRPTVVTYGGVSLWDHTHSPSQALGPTLIFVGRLADDTGILAYLEGLRIACVHNHGLQFDIFGDGPLSDECETFIAQHHLPAKLHGFVPNATQFFPQYQIVCASQYLSILAAFAANKPVIAFADQPIKQTYLERTPFAEWLTIAHSPAEIAEAMAAMTALARGPKPKNQHAAGWARKQTWEKVAKEYLELWQK